MFSHLLNYLDSPFAKICLVREGAYQRIAVSFVPAWKTMSSPALSCQLLKTRKGFSLGQLTYHIQMKEQGSYPQV